MAISFQKITYIYDAGMPYAHAAINDIDLELEEGKPVRGSQHLFSI